MILDSRIDYGNISYQINVENHGTYCRQIKRCLFRTYLYFSVFHHLFIYVHSGELLRIIYTPNGD